MASNEQMLQGKRCLITGASGDIGCAIAKAYARQGADLILVAPTTAECDEVVSCCQEPAVGCKGAKCEVHTCDLTDSRSLEELATRIVEAGGVHVLVNAAGYMAQGGLTALEGSPDEWEKMIAVNMAAPMRLTRRLAPGMVQMGASKCAVITIASTSGQHPTGDQSAYAATKYGVRGWNKSCYEDLRHKGIKVMTISPSLVHSHIGKQAAAIRKGEHFDLGCMIEPSDIAEVALLPWRMSANACPEEVNVGVCGTVAREA